MTGPSVAAADVLDVSLLTRDGSEMVIGQIERDTSGKMSFERSEEPFGEFFLSMRPFRCIDGEAVWCRLPYPYEKPPAIAEGDLWPLEYEFLFIVKKAGEYGIDPFHGRYFVLTPDGSGGYDGALHAVDLDRLAVPPEAGVIRPITHDHLDEAELENERFVSLRIR